MAKSSVQLTLFWCVFAACVAVLLGGLASRAGAQSAPTADDELILTLGNWIHFKHARVSGALNRSDVDALFDLELPDGARRVWRVPETDELRSIRTCRDNDNIPYGRGGAMDSLKLQHFRTTCGLLYALREARTATRSFLGATPLFEIDPREYMAGYWKGIEFHSIDPGPKDPHVIVFHADCVYFSLSEITRADFNDDGLEDILIEMYTFNGVVNEEWGCPTPGNGSYVTLDLLTKRTAESPFELISYRN